MQDYTECMTVIADGTADGTDAADQQRPSLRERKKLATRRSIRRVALGLIAERGFAHVTVEDIAEAADISPRTFFNYFPSKEAALFGADHERTEGLRQRLLDQPLDVAPLDALRAALVGEACAVAEELDELGGDPGAWLARMKAANVDPHLRAAQAAHMAAVERVLAGALAERLGTEADRDPYPLLLVSASMGAMRAVVMMWAGIGGAVALERLTDAAFQCLAEGFPEQCELRSIVADAIGTGQKLRAPLCQPVPVDQSSAERTSR
jgi:AcrR family transcriptional regulator